MSGEGFEFTPFGLKPLGADSVAQGDGFAGAVIPKPVQAHVDLPPRSISDSLGDIQRRHEAHVATKTGTVSPCDVVKLAKSRIKELRTEIKQLTAKKRELAELERLVRAAKEKPRATVRTIDSARRTG